MTRKILALAVATLVTACAGEASDARVSDRVPVAERVASAPRQQPVVLVLGTSLTAGLGVELDQAYPALLQTRIDSAGLPYRVVNAGVSGETSAGGLRRIDWLLRESIGVLVLELGANDGLRGLDPEDMRRNLQTIIDRTRSAHPAVRIVIAGMEAPPNMGGGYTEEFRRVFSELARQNQAELIPFLLDGVAGVAELNQADGIHPTVEGHQRIAETVWDHLESVLRQASPRSENR